MSKDEAKAELESLGASDVWFLTQPVDHHDRWGVGLSFHSCGETRRFAVRAVCEENTEEHVVAAALPTLMTWAREELRA